MTSAVYLEQLLDSMDHLPAEVQRNMELMRDLDQRCQVCVQEADKLSSDYLKKIGVSTKHEKREMIAEIKKKFAQAKQYSDDKIQVSRQTYDLVDKYIRRLDSDLMRFEAEIQEVALNRASQPEETATKKRGRKKSVEKGKSKKATVVETVSKSGKQKSKKSGKGKTSVVAEPEPVVEMPALSRSTDAIDMPVDPNEPTYCLCNQVSYGEMIGCDNVDCPIEWFHFACVKLISKPKGNWYCPNCTTEKRKK